MNLQNEFEYFKSPIGWFEICVEEGYLKSLTFSAQKASQAENPGPVSGMVKAQLEEYFSGRRTEFNLPLSSHFGTPFQNEIWQEMNRIPFSKTVSYGELAHRVGRPKAARAVGQACNKNPWPIVVPCHRVVASQGEGGYALGLESKRKLLDHERRVVLKLTPS